MKNYLKKLAKSLFNDESKEMSAKNAYLISKYGKVMTQEQILNALINDITIDIREKTQKRCYSLSVDITPMNEDYVEDIKKHFEEKNFKVFLITKKVFEELGSGGVIFLSWG